MKLYAYLILLGSMLFGYSIQAKQKRNLTVDDAIEAIWKMNYKDISELHKKTDSLNVKSESGLIKKLADKIWGKSYEKQILEMLRSKLISPEQKERILQAIKDSYKEYEYNSEHEINMQNNPLLFLLTFPISSLVELAETSDYRQKTHIEKIEFERACNYSRNRT